jgi:hypothetical protein
MSAPSPHPPTQTNLDSECSAQGAPSPARPHLHAVSLPPAQPKRRRTSEGVEHAALDADLAARGVVWHAGEDGLRERCRRGRGRPAGHGQSSREEIGGALNVTAQSKTRWTRVKGQREKHMASIGNKYIDECDQ